MAEKTQLLGMIEHRARKSPYQSDYHSFRMAKSINNHHGCQLHPFKSPLLFVKVPLNHHCCWLNSHQNPLNPTISVGQWAGSAQVNIPSTSTGPMMASESDHIDPLTVGPGGCRGPCPWCLLHLYDLLIKTFFFIKGILGLVFHHLH